MTERDYLNDLEQMVLLAVLRLKEDAYGGSVRRELAATARRDMGRGALYTAIDRLVERGAIETHLGVPEPGRGGRPKRFLAVTPWGLGALKAATEGWRHLWDGIEELGDAS